MGRLFGEFTTGQRFETPGRTITETDIVAFVPASTMFESWLPMDSEPFRKRNCNARLEQRNWLK